MVPAKPSSPITALPVALLLIWFYLDGVPDHKIKQENLVDQLEAEIRAKAAAKEAQMAIDAEQIIARG